jgi:hypothetical protein
MADIYALWYNFVRIHNTLRMTAEIVAGIETHLLAMEDVVAIIDRRTATRTGTLLGSWAANRRPKKRASRGLSNKASNTPFLFGTALKSASKMQRWSSHDRMSAKNSPNGISDGRSTRTAIVFQVVAMMTPPLLDAA